MIWAMPEKFSGISLFILTTPNSFSQTIANCAEAAIDSDCCSRGKSGMSKTDCPGRARRFQCAPDRPLMPRRKAFDRPNHGQ